MSDQIFPFKLVKSIQFVSPNPILKTNVVEKGIYLGDEVEYLHISDNICLQIVYASKSELNNIIDERIAYQVISSAKYYDD